MAKKKMRANRGKGKRFWVAFWKDWTPPFSFCDPRAAAQLRLVTPRCFILLQQLRCYLCHLPASSFLFLRIIHVLVALQYNEWLVAKRDHSILPQPRAKLSRTTRQGFCGRRWRKIPAAAGIFGTFGIANMVTEFFFSTTASPFYRTVMLTCFTYLNNKVWSTSRRHSLCSSGLGFGCRLLHMALFVFGNQRRIGL